MKSSEDDLLVSLSKQFSIPYLKEIPSGISSELISQFPLSFLKTFKIFPLKKEKGKVTVVMADPFVPSLDELETILKSKVERVLGKSSEILRLIEKCYYQPEDSAKVEEDLNKDSEVTSLESDFLSEGADNLLDLCH